MHAEHRPHAMTKREIKKMDHFQISGSNILRRPDQVAEGKADCAASIGGIFLSTIPLATFLKAERGCEKKGSEEKRTPLPQLRNDRCLVVASKMTFLPSP